MCLPANFDILTLAERLQEMADVRRHHQELLDGYSASWRGRNAYLDHLAEHKAAAARLRAERLK